MANQPLTSSTVAESRAGETRPCRHCGQPLPDSAPADYEFCCSGCEFVFRTISGLGLQDFYRYRDQSTDVSPAANPRHVSYGLFDEQAFQERHIVHHEGSASVSLYVQGVHCTACVWLIEKLPSILSGVIESRLDFGSSEIMLRFDPARVKLSTIAQTLDSLGYPAHPKEHNLSREQERAEDRRMLLRTGVAAICALNTMMLAVSLYQGLFTGIQEEYADFFRWISLLLTVPAMTYSAVPFYRTAWGSLRHGALHIDFPIAVAILVAFTISAFNTLSGGRHVYFDTVTALIFLLLAGRVYLRRAVRRARENARSGWDFLPAMARVVEQGGCVEVPCQLLEAGKEIEVRAGERFPADGCVRSGSSCVDRSVLSGESLPLGIEPGSGVFAGDLNLDSPVRITVTSKADDSRLGKIINQVMQKAGRAPIVMFTDRVGRWFTMVVFVLSCVTFLAWLGSGVGLAVENAIALLIVTCPCALALATPVAFSTALGRAAKAGIFIKGEDVIERLTRVCAIYFDKTGTLTEGALTVEELHELSGDGAGVEVNLRALADVAPYHPVARALLRHFSGGAGLQEGALRYSRLVPGRGVEGEDAQGHMLRLGSLKWILELGVDVPAKWRGRIDIWAKEGHLISCLSKQNQLTAVIVLRDSVRAGASKVVAELLDSGRSLGILSGDSSEAVSKVARELGLPSDSCLGGLSPEQKAGLVRQGRRPCAVAGDGVNDLLAMKEADVAIGIRGGAEVNLEVADIYIREGSIIGLGKLFSGAGRTMSIVRRNLWFSLVYNVAGAGLAMAGLMNPLIAAVLMPLSSITVIMASTMSRSFET